MALVLPAPQVGLLVLAAFLVVQFFVFVLLREVFRDRPAP